jgi:hypothetical protein
MEPAGFGNPTFDRKAGQLRKNESLIGVFNGVQFVTE